ncbi:glycoside hydrolase family 2 protein [Planctomycetota bacterium]
MRRFVCILVLSVLNTVICTQLHAAVEKSMPGWYSKEISNGWKIKSITPRKSLDASFLAKAEEANNSDGWLIAPTMPAMIHDILLEHGKIETPWLPGTAEKCQWVAERDWVYTVHFEATEINTESLLRFNGLDTIVDVYLNGQQIASHSNMYLPLVVDVSGKLRKKNTLVLHFHSVYEKSEGELTRIRNINGDPERRVRRPNQNYSKYLGPHPNFSRVGVYDRIFLETTYGSRMAEVVAGASLNDNLTVGTVNLDIAGMCRTDNVKISVNLLDPERKTVTTLTSRPSIQEGAFIERMVIKVDKPYLWWPRGYGDQHLYLIQVTLIIDGKSHQTVTRKVGFRRVNMQKRLHFEINGVPVRLWGGCWVTPRWDTAVWDQSRVQKLFEMAEHAHFNAFRVWGVVESPRDDFYEMADARGFLLWQDFTELPLAADNESRAICRREATLLIKRLKHHPSIVVWCGGNEAAMWNHQEYNGKLEDRGPWRGLVAAEDVGEICRKFDLDRYYQPSSPYYGENPNDPKEGNTHGYTNMWFVPGYDFLNFASEDTRIAAPPLHSIKRFMAPEDIWPSDYSPIYKHGDIYPYPKTWLRYTTGTSWKKTGPVELFYDAIDAASLVYRLGMAEALYYQDVIERQRHGRQATDTSGRRLCGGYLVWKFNDSWPQVYSGKVDYFLEPYHVYYTLRRAFAPVLLSFDKGAYIYLWVVNDTPKTVAGTARIQLLHLDRNEIRKEIVRQVSIEPGRSKVIVRLDQAGIATFRKEHILYAELTDESGQIIAEAHCLGDIERRVTFPDARLDVKIRDTDLVITSDKYARSVTLMGNTDGNEFGWFFEDNYFDLMPGREKIVRILGDHRLGLMSVKAWYSPHITEVEWHK